MDVLEHHDVLADILRHLPPRSLAACRCVCAAWRAAVDDHRLLRADLLPLSLDGIIYQTQDSFITKNFSRTSMADRVAAAFRGLDDNLPELMDCRNGLLLFWHYVLNPATRQVAQLPPQPRPCEAMDCTRCWDDHYLIYDPTVSPHFEVILVPYPHHEIPVGHISRHMCGHGSVVSAMEWPPSPYIMHVFSSRTGSWEKRSFRRQGEAAGALADVKIKLPNLVCFLYHVAYWREALYVRCGAGFIMRIDLRNDMYQVIELPNGKEGTPRLGKSKNGVYCALRHGRCTFEVWFLDESHGRMEWVFKNKVNLEPIRGDFRKNHTDEQWIEKSCAPLKRDESKTDINLERVDDNNQAPVEDAYDWSSDNENAIDTVEWPGGSSFNAYVGPAFECLGFHPYKEIVLFNNSERTLAYHFKSSKVRHLGKMEVNHLRMGVEESFPYAPCWVRNLPGSS
ncbi:hypothetical protein CFC21_090694 [Triticum aestivum]|uniref:F-box domain-containing protein n=2 Tax=Triticum aestivum TaxID=4565 RepID=A0A3B6Q8F8_WHEAT|nr:uncharacterized protein LOC123142896 [Triticum aestivum]KAF7087511.1 hypothetical protein CFC21_090694 [Triticum aestivum]